MSMSRKKTYERCNDLEQFVTHSVEHASEEFIHLPVLVAWPLTAVVKLVFLARLLDEWQLHALMLFSICLHTLDCVQKMCMNGGTQDPDTCNCVCPSEYTGEFCEGE